MAKATGSITINGNPDTDGSTVVVDDGQGTIHSEVTFNTRDGPTDHNVTSKNANLFTTSTNSTSSSRPQMYLRIGGGNWSYNSFDDDWGMDGTYPAKLWISDTVGNKISIRFSTATSGTSGSAVDDAYNSQSRKISTGVYEVTANNGVTGIVGGIIYGIKVCIQDAIDNDSFDLTVLVKNGSNATQTSTTPSTSMTQLYLYSPESTDRGPEHAGISVGLDRHSGSWTTTSSASEYFGIAAYASHSGSNYAITNLNAYDTVGYCWKGTPYEVSHGDLTAAEIADQLKKLINALPIAITATVSSNVVSLTNDAHGTGANVTITTNDSTNFGVSGMSGGSAQGGGGGSTQMARTMLNNNRLAITTALLPQDINEQNTQADLGSTSMEWGDLYMADGKAIKLGHDQEVTLTHVADTGILLNSSMQLQFGDSATHIKQVSDTNLEIEADGSVILDAPVLDLQDDGVIVKFGDDSDVTLTHIADTGLRLNSTMALQFNDASQYIYAPSATVLDIHATDEVEITATLCDINANLDVSGTYTGGGLMTVGGSIVIPDAGTIGSASDTNAIAISSGGVVSVSATTDASSSTSGVLTVAGGMGVAKKLYVGTDLDVDGTANLDIVDIDGAVDMASTLTIGGVTKVGSAAGSGVDAYLYTAGTAAHVGIQWDADGATEGMLIGGADDHGVDFKFFGESAGKFVHWDMSGDELVLGSSAKLSFNDAAGDETILASADGHLEVNAGTTLDMTAPTVDINAATAVTIDTPGITVTDSTTSSATEGGYIRLASDDGAALADDHRLGVIEFAAAEDGSSTMTVGARIEAIADATWSDTENGAALVMYTTDGNAAQSEVLRLDSDKLATFAGAVTVTGDLTINGTTSTVNSTVVTIDDPIFTLGGDTAPSSDDNKDRGIEFRYYDSAARIGFMGWDDSASGFTLLSAASNSSEVFSGTAAPLVMGGLTATTIGATGACTLASSSGVTTIGATTGATVSAAGIINVNNATDATSTTDGSLQTDGGLSVAKAIYNGTSVLLAEDSGTVTMGATTGAVVTAAGILNINNQTDASSKTDGSLQTDGGLSVAKKAYVGTGLTVEAGGIEVDAGDVNIDSTTAASSKTTGALKVAGGISAQLKGHFGTGLTTDSGGLTVTAGGVEVSAGRVLIDDTTDATTTSDGALVVAGGISCGEDVVIGNDLDLLSDGAIMNFGADQDVNLTHVHDTGLLLNSSRQLQFGDSATHIKQVADGQLEMEADVAIQLDAPIIDFEDDGVVLQFGDGDDVTLTHVHDAGLRVNSTMALQFQDAGTKIWSSEDGQLDLQSDGTMVDSILLNGSAGGVKINSALDGNAAAIHLDSASGLTFAGGDQDDSVYFENSPIQMEQISAPSTTTDKLYNVSGVLYWAGARIGAQAGHGIKDTSGTFSIVSVEHSFMSASTSDFVTGNVAVAGGAVANTCSFTGAAGQALSGSIQVYLNGMLLTRSGSISDKGMSAAMQATASSYYDYRFDSLSTPTKVYLEDSLDSDDVLTVRFIARSD